MLNTIAATVIAPVPPLLEVQAQPPHAPAAHPFAELLRQNQGQNIVNAAKVAAPKPPPPPPAPAPAPASPPASRPESGNEPAPAVAPKSSDAAKAKARTADAKTEHAPKAEQADKDDPLPSDAKAAEHVADTTTPQADPAIAQWLADLHLPAARSGAANEAAANASVDGSGLDASVATKKVGDAFNGVDARRLGSEPNDKAGADAVDAKALLRQDQLAGAAVATVAATTPRSEPAASRTDAGTNAGALAAAAFNPGGSTLAPASAPLAVHIATPFAAAEFAQVFGAQVSLLAKDGVHSAELHLNPAEMGPVSVQIVMDGTQARVDFGADTAATRHAIEAGLPELASALRDAGLTLSGGGVSQHSAGGQQSDGGPAQRGGSAAADGSGGGGVETVRAARPRSGVAGGVDLYA